jgi:signal transduction histidine kinase/ActR/RegA family two-component response regulator
MKLKLRPPLQSFPLAALAVLIASIARTFVYLVWNETIPYTPFYPAVIVATMMGGWRAGLFATALAGLAASFWLEPFGEPLIVEPTDLVGMSLFLVVCAIIVWLCEKMRLAQQEAEQAAEVRRALLVAEQQARAAAEAASRLKDEFVASVSHELRTPLQAILGWSEVLRLAHFDAAKCSSAVETIQRNARLQSQLIEDLLDMSRIVAGKMQLDVRAVRLEEVISAAIETVLPAAKAKSIHIEQAIDPAVVIGDFDRLQQVLWNLLSNAIKFTPKEGHISVAVRVSSGQANIAVSDSGAGIEPQFLPYVFERFRQADTAASRRYGGLGLGLSIVKNLVELHGGTVSARSEGVNRGATFLISLPVADAAVFTGTIPAGKDVEARSLDGLRILFVDDDSDTCRLVKDVLEQCNAEVFTAISASEALAQFDEWKPDLLISDLGMPEQDGFALIQMLRERGISELPAVAFTAYTADEDRRRSLVAGYQLHLAKPIEPAAFTSAIAEVARPKAK